MDNNTLNHLGLELGSGSLGESDSSSSNNLYSKCLEYNKNTICSSITYDSLLYASAPCYITFQHIKDTSRFDYIKSASTSYGIKTTPTTLTMCKYYHGIKQLLGSTISGEVLYDTAKKTGSTYKSRNKMNLAFKTQLPSLDISPFSTLDQFQLLYNPYDFSSSGFPILNIDLGSFTTYGTTETRVDSKISVWATPLENIDNFKFICRTRNPDNITLSDISNKTTLKNLINGYVSDALVEDTDRLTLYYTSGSKIRLSSFYENYISGHFA